MPPSTIMSRMVKQCWGSTLAFSPSSEALCSYSSNRALSTQTSEKEKRKKREREKKEKKTHNSVQVGKIAPLRKWLADEMAEIHVETFPITEVWIRSAAMKDNLRHALLNDLEVLRPESDTKWHQWGGGGGEVTKNYFAPTHPYWDRLGWEMHSAWWKVADAQNNVNTNLDVCRNICNQPKRSSFEFSHANARMCIAGETK